ncbi:MAG: UPF0104 family protein [Methanobrevibacter sp.]|nr:UPF0104 family protein [Methanobrevibacter sp.]MBE6490742.1 UPF0104 family protein [Methanobrevibacter sp.]
MDKKSAFFIILSVAILAVMLYLIGIDKVVDALENANLFLIALAVLIQFGTYFLYTYRWQIVNRIANINVGFKKLFPIVMVGLAVNNITPSGRGGGEPVRAYILAKEHGYDMKDTFATVVADRVLDTFPFIVLAIITIIATVLYFDFPMWLEAVLVVSVIGIILILAALIYMCINEHFGIRIENFIFRLVHRFSKKGADDLRNVLHENISGFQNTMNVLISERKLMYYTIPLSFLIWVFEILRVYVVFLAFGASLNVIVIGEVFILASLVGMIPLLPGGLGAVDGLMIGLYSRAGCPAGLAGPVTMVERLISFWMASIIGLVILPHYGSSVLDKISIGNSAEELENSLENE